MTIRRHPSLIETPWSGMTLPGLLKGAALLRPDKVLVVDGPDCAAVAGHAPRTLDARGFWAKSQHCARQLQALGLRPGDHVLVHLGNTSDALIGLVAVMMAGGAPAALPAFWSRQQVRQAAELVEAAGILTCVAFAGLRLAEQARLVAADCASLRFVAAFGGRTPAGVAALDSFVPAASECAARLAQPRADASALITFDTVCGPVRAFSRSHEQLVAEASIAAAGAQIAADSRLLVTLPPATVAGALFGLGAPLLTGACAELAPLFDGCGFARQLGNGRGLTIIMPGQAEAAFNDHCSARKIRSETVVFVHRPAVSQPDGRLRADHGHGRIVDMTWLGEACGWSARRGRSRLEKSGQRQNPAGIEGGPSGNLIVAGPLAPAMVGTAGETIDTGFPAGAIEALRSRPHGQPEAA